MCEYCQGQSELINTIKYDIEYYENYPSAISTGNKLYIKEDKLVLTNQQVESKITIHYCPMCGEKLSEVN